MENAIQFIEEYWGVTIAGGVTVGSIISFVVIQMKYIIQARVKDVEIQGLINSVKQSVTATSDVERFALTQKQLLVKEIQAIEEQKQILIEENAHFRQTEAVLFKAISYLVIASKLPIEEKIALQEDFMKLKTKTVEPETVELKSVESIIEAANNPIEAVEEPTEKEQEVFTTIKNVVEKATTLLDKYAKKPRKDEV
jgi:hypothetical protein